MPSSLGEAHGKPPLMPPATAERALRGRALPAILVVGGFLAVTLLLYASPGQSLQYWFLFSAPLTLASYFYGLRGALVGSVVTLSGILLLVVQAASNAGQNISALVVLAATESAISQPDFAARVQALGALAESDLRGASLRAYGGLIAIVLTNVFFGITVDRSRLQSRLRVQQATEQFKRYFSPQLVDAIVSGQRQTSLTTVRKEVTVLFADLRGFTSLTERVEPEELSRLLNEYLSAMTDVVFKYDGTLDKYIGDAVMAFFGDPVSHGDDPERAVRAAVEMRDRFLSLRAAWEKAGYGSLHVGIGMNTGYAAVGNIGSLVRVDYTVIGSAVNVASRLADRAAPGQILTTQRTLAEARHIVEARRVGALDLQGVPHPVDAVEILGLRALALPTEAHLEVAANEQVLERVASDPAFRALLLSQPDQALAPFRLPDDQAAQVREIAGLAGFGLFRGVSPAGLVTFARQARRHHLPADAVLTATPGDGARAYVVCRGEVGLYDADDDGRERHLRTVGRGEAFVADGNSATVRSHAEGDLLSLGQEDLNLLANTDRVLAERLLADVPSMVSSS